MMVSQKEFRFSILFFFVDPSQISMASHPHDACVSVMCINTLLISFVPTPNTLFITRCIPAITMIYSHWTAKRTPQSRKIKHCRFIHGSYAYRLREPRAPLHSLHFLDLLYARRWCHCWNARRLRHLSTTLGTFQFCYAWLEIHKLTYWHTFNVNKSCDIHVSSLLSSSLCLIFVEFPILIWFFLTKSWCNQLFSLPIPLTCRQQC